MLLLLLHAPTIGGPSPTQHCLQVHAAAPASHKATQQHLPFPVHVCRPSPCIAQQGSQVQLQRPRLRPSSSSSVPEAATASSAPAAAEDPTQQPSTSGRVDPQVTTFDDDLPHECLFYDWKWGSKISCVRAGRSGPPLLLCHGFGVGSYHFDRNIPVLAQNHRVGASRPRRQLQQLQHLTGLQEQ